jgi:hypothetical protein
MTDLFNINSPKFLGGVAITSALTLAGVAYLVWKQAK